MDMRNRRILKPAAKTAGQRYWHDGKRMLGQHLWLRNGNKVIDIAGDQYGWPETFQGSFSADKFKKFEKLSGMGAVLDQRDTALAWFKDWNTR